MIDFIDTLYKDFFFKLFAQFFAIVLVLLKYPSYGNAVAAVQSKLERFSLLENTRTKQPNTHPLYCYQMARRPGRVQHLIRKNPKPVWAEFPTLG